MSGATDPTETVRDVADSRHRQAVTADGTGSMAALGSEILLETLEHAEQTAPEISS